MAATNARSRQKKAAPSPETKRVAANRVNITRYRYALTRRTQRNNSLRRVQTLI